tara:strand:+ start:102 stop:317 length:216 start_codon:yes stop_codon:yes gene_type:complete
MRIKSAEEDVNDSPSFKPVRMNEKSLMYCLLLFFNITARNAPSTINENIGAHAAAAGRDAKLVLLVRRGRL